jgi:hypothetical protein
MGKDCRQGWTKKEKMKQPEKLTKGLIFFEFEKTKKGPRATLPIALASSS